MKAFNAKRALQLARAAALAYRDDTDEAGRRLGASAVLGFAHLATFGYTARVGEEVFVAFRGTDPRQVWSWITNFSVAQMPSATGRTHQGMTTALEAVWPQVESQIHKLARPGERVWFTGHS